MDSLMEQRDRVIHAALSAGASLAGIAGVASLGSAPSHEKTSKNIEWHCDAKAVLVLAQAHVGSRPELDWWDGKGGTPGNRMLEEISRRLARRFAQDLNIRAKLLPYHVDGGGVFLKDAAVLAGLGSLGANNLVVTPAFGPRVRLRALALDVEFPATGPMAFHPCKTCEKYCLRACPQDAFSNSVFHREACGRQMLIDESNRMILRDEETGGHQRTTIEYCRECELACPVGRGSGESASSSEPVRESR